MDVKLVSSVFSHAAESDGSSDPDVDEVGGGCVIGRSIIESSPNRPDKKADRGGAGGAADAIGC